MLEKEVLQVLKPLHRYRNFVIVVSALNILVQLAPPYLMGILIDEIYPASTGLSDAFFIAGSIVAVLILCFVLDWLRRYLWGDVINKGAGTVRHFLFENVLHKNYRFFINHHAGDINNKVINDAYLYVQSKLMTTPMMVLNMLHIGVIFVFLFMLNMYMKVITLVFAGALFLVYSFINKYLRQTALREREAFSRLMDEANETLEGINTIQLYQAESFFAHNFERSVDRYERRLSRLKFWQSLSKAATSVITNVLPVAAILSGIVYLSMGGNISVGTILSFYYFLPRLKEPIMSLTDFNIDVQNAKAVEERLSELLATEVREDRDLPKIDRINSLTFDNVGYVYPDGERVLAGVTKTIERGKCMAISGPSGTGKTTMLRLLMQQALPTEGAIKVNGTTYTDFNHNSYINRMVVLSQDVFVFDDTLHANISFGGRFSEKKVREAATLSEIEHFSMDENALGLSGGERQRLGLARALACDYDVLLLDEPTSNLDHETETRIIKNLKQVLADTNCMMIVITHSDNVLNNLCNDELVLDKH